MGSVSPLQASEADDARLFPETNLGKPTDKQKKCVGRGVGAILDSNTPWLYGAVSPRWPLRTRGSVFKRAVEDARLHSGARCPPPGPVDGAHYSSFVRVSPAVIEHTCVKPTCPRPAILSFSQAASHLPPARSHSCRPQTITGSKIPSVLQPRMASPDWTRAYQSCL